MRRILLLAAGIAALAPLSTGLAAAADGVPSGQRLLGQSVVEPVYDADHAGSIGFISTPSHAPVNADRSAVAPLYLPVYPANSTVGALICPHVPVDTCPSHGPNIAGLAAATEPGVYGPGVLGHDHLAAFPGGDFHVTLEPIVVLFTNSAAANEHLVTSDAVAAAISRGDAIAIPLPGATLHGEHVPLKVWKLATPVQ